VNRNGSRMRMYKRHSIKKCYKRLHYHKSDENIQKYKSEERRKTVSEARGQAYAELNKKLDTKEDENDVYKIAKL
jgi:shikimate kinase